MDHPDTLANIGGPFPLSLVDIRLDTWQHADEISAARRTDAATRALEFITADFALYGKAREGKYFEPMLYLGRGSHNPYRHRLEPMLQEGWQGTLREMFETIERMRSGDILTIDTDAIIAAPDTLRIPLRNIAPEVCENSDIAYFEFSPEKFSGLTPTQKSLLDRTYGTEQGLMGGRFHVLSSRCVWQLKDDGFIFSTCWLQSLSNGHANFSAYRSFPPRPDIAIRGAPISPSYRRAEPRGC